ncbi:MAG: ABC-ATPase domain-containing protein [Lachnospiraceae bacterium]|nr:ABC-ATPase domain-containing protein [Lachnospiraceae bacterium]
MRTSEDLRKMLFDIDHRSYPAYKQTKGEYRFDGYVLSIDHVQGDPFASPSKVSVRVGAGMAGFPEDYYTASHRRVALEDDLTRRFAEAVRKNDRRDSGSGKSGLIASSRPGQEVLERTCCRVIPGSGEIIFRMEVGFPAFGRSINSKELIHMLFDLLPEYVKTALTYHEKEKSRYEDMLYLADDRLAIREALKEEGLVAFVADGAVLPRKSGVSDLPMEKAVPFKSPESLRFKLTLPHAGEISGMGIREGITLIVGGGYHGKSTLLKALEKGVYDHIRGDGREYVITENSAMKIRSEDGRCVHSEDISLFISNLPDGRDAGDFSTEDASGSTSQAANVIEAIECGTGTLLIDEDTCATNFMVRDELMQRVINKEKEPITPFIDRMRYIKDSFGISCILVAGSSGAFFGVADNIIQMDSYVPYDITDTAKTEFEKSGIRSSGISDAKEPDFSRMVSRVGIFRDKDRIKVKSHGKDGFSIDREDVDIRYLEQLADHEQTLALAQIVKLASLEIIDGNKTFRSVLDQIGQRLDKEGLETLCGRLPSCGLAKPRRQEIAAALNRCRFLRIIRK